jgi:Holliday junction resolvasome RuvABC DNA-binding subunit
MSKKRQHRPAEAGSPTRIAWGSSANPALTEAILAVVDQQLRDTTPRETQRTFDRLVALGYTPEDARRLIGTVVAQEIFAVMQREDVYSERRYIAALQGLPESAV